MNANGVIADRGISRSRIIDTIVQTTKVRSELLSDTISWKGVCPACTKSHSGSLQRFSGETFDFTDGGGGKTGWLNESERLHGVSVMYSIDWEVCLCQVWEIGTYKHVHGVCMMYGVDWEVHLCQVVGHWHIQPGVCV